eukprot:TRINITY_DN26569_c0_g3_i1.p1 TRINITY_DN26569_c0_g3~~TRINITY_DN26569_c0_g3_i1.p1  ORF type:complete len:170 (+),score=17.50 TRINITY_DN26569_c0_g3_i1:90-599(+)
MDRMLSCIVLSATVMGSASYRIRESGDALQDTKKIGVSSKETSVLQGGGEHAADLDHGSAAYFEWGEPLDSKEFGQCAAGVYGALQAVTGQVLMMAGMKSIQECADSCAQSYCCQAMEYYTSQIKPECRHFYASNVNQIWTGNIEDLSVRQHFKCRIKHYLETPTNCTR